MRTVFYYESFEGVGGLGGGVFLLELKYAYPVHIEFAESPKLGVLVMFVYPTIVKLISTSRGQLILQIIPASIVYTV